MARELQKSPQGLLGALELKTLGHNPSEFSSIVVPSIDTLDFYLLGNRSFATGNAASGALGATLVTLLVPQDRIWRLKTIAVFLIRNVADAALIVELGVSIRRAGSSAAMGLFTPRYEAVPATDLVQDRALILGNPLFLGPGDSLLLIQRSTLTAGGTGGVSVDFDLFQNS